MKIRSGNLRFNTLQVNIVHTDLWKTLTSKRRCGLWGLLVWSSHLQFPRQHPCLVLPSFGISSNCTHASIPLAFSDDVLFSRTPTVSSTWLILAHPSKLKQRSYRLFPTRTLPWASRAEVEAVFALLASAPAQTSVSHPLTLLSSEFPWLCLVHLFKTLSPESAHGRWTVHVGLNESFFIF